MSETGSPLIAGLCALLAVSMLPACWVELVAFFLALTVMAAWMCVRIDVAVPTLGDQTPAGAPAVLI